ncbi:MAG TPA: RNA polymerase sigma factor region1.1 domain-containing protein, partial [Candidatus Manganitrophaceae bacterium]
MAKDEKADEVKQLISLGKEKGYLTYDELNNALPADMVSSEQIDNLMMMFGEMDIEIIDTPEEERYQKMMAEPEEEREGFKGLEETEQEAEEEEKVKEIDLTPGVLSRTADPVRLYLKEMGSVPLLSREGEIEIAKKIEEGEKEVAAVVFGTPMIIRDLLSLGEKLRHSKISIREVVSAFDEEFEEEETTQEQDDAEVTARTLEAISKMRSPYRDLMRAYQRLKRTGSDPAKRRKIKGQLREIKSQIADRIEQVNLHPALIDRMTGQVKALAANILQAEREITNCKRRLGVSGEEGLLVLKKIGRGPVGLKSVRRKTGLS